MRLHPEPIRFSPEPGSPLHHLLIKGDRAVRFHTPRAGRLARTAIIGAAGLLAVALGLTGCSGSPGAAGGGGTAAGGSKFTLGFVVGGQPNADWQQLQGTVAKALAKKRGWNYVQLSNENSESTAVKDAQIMVQKKVNMVMMFNGQPAANPVIAKIYKTAKIPVATFDIAQPGWYFVGVDNAKAGKDGGTALGQLAKTKWNCKVDLVLSVEGTSAGLINTQRTGGARNAVKAVCPSIPASAYVSTEGDGNTATALKNAPGVLAAHPNAKHILIVGINDNAVIGAIQAAEQLGRGDAVMAWGQDGSQITGSNVDAHLSGSVLYFLEGYPAYAFQIADKIAAGKAPAVNDSGTNPAVSVQPCPVSQDQAKSVPGINDRVTKISGAKVGTTMFDLYCPKS
jgi:ABC-type sugar transport system substrate-binding protein